MEYENFIAEYRKSVYLYKEFQETKTSRDIYKHQSFLATWFGNIYNETDELLLFHEMGAGKTCTSIRIAERLLTLHPHEYRGVIVIARGQGLINNFVNEIAEKCTDSKYKIAPATSTDGEINEKLFRSRQRKKIHQTYTFFTFEILAKMIKDLPDKVLMQRFDSHIIIIDEAHNIRDNEHNTHLKIYNEIHRLLHVLQHRKIVLLTGTPMKDGPDELAGIMNLILPLDHQMPVGNAFATTFFDESHQVKNAQLLKSYLRRRVSFVKSVNVDVPKVYMGKVVAPLTHFKLVCLPMRDEQNAAYERAWRVDAQHVNVYNNTRQTSLYVDDEGKCGKQAKAVALSKLADYSCKYAFVIDRLEEASAKGELSMVYSDLIQGSGLLMLAKLLDQRGWSSSPRQRRSYIVLTSCISEAKKQHLLGLFNSAENARGEIINALLGSRVITEGFTLRNVIHEHILTPHWNYGETSQVIARGWRNSHHELIAMGLRPVVHIYQYAAVARTFPSIDLIMYNISEKKDFQINKIVQLVKESAFDCYLFKERNECGEDGERDCQYRSCKFTCDGEPREGDAFSITRNYDLHFYTGSTEWTRHLGWLRDLFRSRWCVTWSEFETMLLLDVTRMQLVQLIKHVVNTYVVMVNPRGNASHVRYDDTGVYLTTLYDRKRANFYDYLLSKYESKPMHTTAALSMCTYLRRNFVADVKRFQNDKNFLINMPTFLQRMLLKNVLRLRCTRPEAHVALQRTVWLHYKSSVYEDDHRLGYHLRRGDSFCVDKRTGYECDTRVVDDYFQARKVQFENNEYGCYGQENRDLGEFCIKITDNNNKSSSTSKKGGGCSGGGAAAADRRKIKSGRRCVNWHKSELIKLIEDKLKFPVDHALSRIELCRLIEMFLKSKKLIENDDTCGTQYKRKLLDDDENS